MKPSFQKILVPVDFSASSAAALKLAMELSAAFRGSVHLIHAWEVPAYLRPDLTVWAGEVSATLGDQMRFGAERAMQDFSKENGLEGNPSVTTEVLQGRPYEVITSSADEGHFDLIVMGTHGRTGMSHLFLGSVAEKVVRHSRCPVLTVRAPSADSH